MKRLASLLLGLTACATPTPPAGLPPHCIAWNEWYNLEQVAEEAARVFHRGPDGRRDNPALAERLDYLDTEVCDGLNAWRGDPADVEAE